MARTCPVAKSAIEGARKGAADATSRVPQNRAIGILDTKQSNIGLCQEGAAIGISASTGATDSMDSGVVKKKHRHH
jgi:hypothetical protein